VSRVHGWNARKRKIITAAHIKIAYERLVFELVRLANPI